MRFAPIGLHAFAVALLLVPIAGHSAEYQADLAIVADLEELRPLVDGCVDLGELEEIRNALDSVSDIEKLRSVLDNFGYAHFSDCPAGIKATGVRRTD